MYREFPLQPLLSRCFLYLTTSSPGMDADGADILDYGVLASDFDQYPVPGDGQDISPLRGARGVTPGTLDTAHLRHIQNRRLRRNGAQVHIRHTGLLRHKPVSQRPLNPSLTLPPPHLFHTHSSHTTLPVTYRTNILSAFRLLNTLGNLVLLTEPPLWRRKKPGLSRCTRALNRLVAFLVFWTYPRAVEQSYRPRGEVERRKFEARRL